MNVGIEVDKDEMIGKKFGHLLVLERAVPNVGNRTMYKCVCDCGNTKIVWGTNLRLGRVKSCSHYCATLLKAKERYIGKRFGLLTVEGFAYKDEFGKHYFKCRCDCGNEKIISAYELGRKRYKNQSCGCYKRKINGLYKSRIHRIHRGMISRCYCKNAPYYKWYGGIGISVCDDWKDNNNGFLNFYNWAMQNGYSDNLTIDRIDNNRNYEPSNCRWITQEEQANNKRNNHNITFSGKTQTIAEWAKTIGIRPSNIYSRIFNSGWSEEEALTIPILRKGYTKDKYLEMFNNGDDVSKLIKSD